MKQRTKTEVYSRICGYIRPTTQWNEGKAQEFKDRVTFKLTGGYNVKESSKEKESKEEIII